MATKQPPSIANSRVGAAADSSSEEDDGDDRGTAAAAKRKRPAPGGKITVVHALCPAQFVGRRAPRVVDGDTRPRPTTGGADAGTSSDDEDDEDDEESDPDSEVRCISNMVKGYSVPSLGSQQLYYCEWLRSNPLP